MTQIVKFAEVARKHEAIKDFVDQVKLCSCGWTPEHVDAGMPVEQYVTQLASEFERHVSGSVARM